MKLWPILFLYDKQTRKRPLVQGSCLQHSFSRVSVYWLSVHSYTEWHNEVGQLMILLLGIRQRCSLKPNSYFYSKDGSQLPNEKKSWSATSHNIPCHWLKLRKDFLTLFSWALFEQELTNGQTDSGIVGQLSKLLALWWGTTSGTAVILLRQWMVDRVELPASLFKNSRSNKNDAHSVSS